MFMDRMTPKFPWKTLLIANSIAYAVLAGLIFFVTGFADKETAQALGLSGSLALALCSPICLLMVLNIGGFVAYVISKVFFGKDGVLSD